MPGTLNWVLEGHDNYRVARNQLKGDTTGGGPFPWPLPGFVVGFLPLFVLSLPAASTGVPGFSIETETTSIGPPASCWMTRVISCPAAKSLNKTGLSFRRSRVW